MCPDSRIYCYEQRGLILKFWEIPRALIALCNVWGHFGTSLTNNSKISILFLVLGLLFVAVATNRASLPEYMVHPFKLFLCICMCEFQETSTGVGFHIPILKGIYCQLLFPVFPSIPYSPIPFKSPCYLILFLIWYNYFILSNH